MRYFDYLAKDPVSGKKIRGVITGDDRETAEESLKLRGITIIQLTPMSDFLNIRKSLHTLSSRVGKKDIKDFFDQLAFMLSTNLQLYNTLTILRDYSVNKKQRTIAQPLAESVRKGLSLHESMQESRFFEYTAIQQVKSGEESGDVPNSLRRLEHQYTREIEFVGKIKNAMTYPVLIMVVMIAVLWILLTMVVPSLADTLTGLGGELPLITTIVIGTSNFVATSTPYIIMLLVLAVVVFKMMLKQPDFRYSVDSLKLKIPLIGDLLTKLEMSRLCRNLSAMQQSGITLVRSLNITKTSIKNHCLRKSLENATNLIEISGMNLGAALSNAGGFPELMIQLIEVGVSAGRVSEVLDKIAEQYEKDVDNNIKKVTSLAEPAMIIIVGVLAGVVVASLMYPIFSIVNSL